MSVFSKLKLIVSTALVAVVAMSVHAIAAEQAAFKKFKGPKPGQWHLAAKVTVPGQKQVINQETETCIKPGEDIKQRALGQLGDTSKGCVVSITQDTESIGSLTTKCQTVSASVEMTRIKEDEYRYKVKSTMASVDTVAKFVGKVCAKEPSPNAKKQASTCDSCKQTVAFLKDQCARLSDASSPSCMNSVTKMQQQCAIQCKLKK